MWFHFQLKPGSSLPASMAGRTVRVAIQCGALNSDTPFRTTCVMFKIKGAISCEWLAFKCLSHLVWIAALLLFTSMALLSPVNIRAESMLTIKLWNGRVWSAIKMASRNFSLILFYHSIAKFVFIFKSHFDSSRKRFAIFHMRAWLN